MIYDILPVNNYSGNGINKKFDFDFYIENESQIKVSLFDENSSKKLLKYNVDYTINELKNKNGSYIIFPKEGSEYGILKNNEKISLELSLPIVQQTRYDNSSLLNLGALEYSFDYLTRIVQILSRKIHLAVKIEECSNYSPDELLNIIHTSTINCMKYANDTKGIKENITNLYNSIIQIKDSINLSKENLEKVPIIETNLSNLANKVGLLENKIQMVGTYKTGTSWLRLWSDKWCEQGNYNVNIPSGGLDISFLKKFAGDYSIFLTRHTFNSAQHMTNPCVTKKSNLIANLNTGSDAWELASWFAYGYVIE